MSLSGKACRASALALLLLAVLDTGCVRHSIETAHAGGTAEYRQIEIGICEDYPEESRRLSLAERDLAVISTNGLKVLRIAFGWDSIESTPGHYDWSFWDDFVDLAVSRYGVRLIPYVCYTPKWAATDQGADSWRSPPRDDQDFARFLRVLVNRYKDRIHSWEIWNEPDNRQYWLGTVDQFSQLLAVGAAAVKEADPKATVVLGGLAWDLQFLEQILANTNAMQRVDVLNLHNYNETWSAEPVEHLPLYIGRARDLLNNHGHRIPIWMAELGYSSFRNGSHVSGQYRARFEFEHTERHQANSLFRALTKVLATEQVDLIAWYRINDLPPKQEVIGDVNNLHLGVLGTSGESKAALRALRWFNTLFGSGLRSLDREVILRSPIESIAEAHAFETPSRTVVLVAWAKTAVPGEHHVESGSAPPLRPVFAEFELPFHPVGKIEVYDETGRLIHQRDPTRRVRLHVLQQSVSVLVMKRP